MPAAPATTQETRPAPTDPIEIERRRHEKDVEKYANEATTVFFVPEMGIGSDACALYVERTWPLSKAMITRVLRIGSLRADTVVIPVVRANKPTQEKYKGDDGGWGFVDIELDELVKDVVPLQPVICATYWQGASADNGGGYRWRNDGEIDPAGFQVALGRSLMGGNPRVMVSHVARFQDAAGRKNGEKPDQLVMKVV